MYTNANGITGKTTSIKALLEANKIDVMAVTETRTKRPPKINGYTWIHKPRLNNTGGGIGFLLKNEVYNSTLIPDDMETRNNKTPTETEILWIKTKDKEPTYLGVFYGKQEKVTNLEAEQEYNCLTEQILNKCRVGNIILTGDFNAKIELKDKLHGINQDESRNGKLLTQTLKTTGCVTTNISDNTKWTRENRNNPNEKSVIDYIITNDENLIKETTVDDIGTARPSGRRTTDHNTIIIKANIKKNKKPTNRKLTWKKADATAWKTYKNTLDEINKIDPPQNYDDLESQIIYALNKTIGQTYQNSKPKEHKEVKEARRSKKEAKQEYKEAIKKGNNNQIKDKLTILIQKQQTLREIIEEHHKNKTTEILNKIAMEGGTKSNTFWKTRRRILNNREDNNYEIIKADGTTINGIEEEKTHIANFFEDLYQARPTIEGYVEKTEEIQHNITKSLKNNTTTPQPIKSEEIRKVLKTIKKKQSSRT